MMNHSRDCQRLWNKTHRRTSPENKPEEEIVPFVARLQQPDSGEVRILDAGCGKGRNAIYLAQAGFRVYGCDLSPLAIYMATGQSLAEGAAVTLQIADLRQLPYAAGCFAAIICIHVLPYHLPADILAIAAEFRRVLQPAGRLYVDLLDREDRMYGGGPQIEPHTFLDEDGMPIHFTRHSDVNLLLPDFTLERIRRSESAATRGRTAWIVWARKT